MECFISALRRVNILMGTDTECTQRFWLWSGGKSLERQILMLPLSQQSVHNRVALLFKFFLCNVL